MRSTDCSGSLMALGAWLVEMCKPRRVSTRWRRNGRSGSALPKGCRVISPHPRMACRSRGTHAGLVVLANSHRQALSVLRDCDSVTSARFPGEERCCIAQKSFFTRASSRLSEAISHSHGQRLSIPAPAEAAGCLTGVGTRLMVRPTASRLNSSLNSPRSIYRSSAFLEVRVEWPGNHCLPDVAMPNSDKKREPSHIIMI